MLHVIVTNASPTSQSPPVKDIHCIIWSKVILISSMNQRLSQTVEPKNTHVEKEAWVAVLYASKWYIGHVREIDDDDVEVSVTFMTACGKYGNCFKWPTDKDELWVKPNDNIYVMPSTPQPSGKTGRIVRNPECELTKIEELSQN